MSTDGDITTDEWLAARYPGYLPLIYCSEGDGTLEPAVPMHTISAERTEETAAQLEEIAWIDDPSPDSGVPAAILDVISAAIAEDVELESPAFTPPELEALAARGFERRNRSK